PSDLGDLIAKLWRSQQCGRQRAEGARLTNRRAKLDALGSGHWRLDDLQPRRKEFGGHLVTSNSAGPLRITVYATSPALGQPRRFGIGTLCRQCAMPLKGLASDIRPAAQPASWP